MINVFPSSVNAAQGVQAGSMGPGRIRFVTHLDVDDVGLARAIEVICGSG